MKYQLSALLGVGGLLIGGQAVLAQSIVQQDTTVVTPVGNQFNITGGETAGTNLFHSFAQFGLSGTETANFNITDPTIQNVLGRVTGGNASVINGAVNITGGNLPNLYLMNPAGIVFGPNFALNIPASFTATTANGIGFGSNWFSATGANTYAILLGEPTALGFTMAQPAAIINAGKISVGSEQKIQLFAGTVIGGGSLVTQNGTIAIGATSGNRIVRLQAPGSPLGFDIQVANGVLPNNLSITPTELPALITAGNTTGAIGVTANADGTVSLVGSSQPIKPGDVALQSLAEIDAFGFCTICPNAVVGQADGTIQTQDIRVFDRGVDAGKIALVAGRDLLTGNLHTDTGNGSVLLRTTGGDIQVKTIIAGTGGIEVDAADMFRATDVLPTDGYKTVLRQYAGTDARLIPFIVGKTGQTEAVVTDAIANSNNLIGMRIPTPVSIRTYLGPIKIRYGDASGPPIVVSDGVTLQGGNARFEVGSKRIAVLDETFIPDSPLSNWADFVAFPFTVKRNETYTPITLSAGTSGSVGSITREVVIDGSLTIAFGDQVFNPLSIAPPVTVTPPTTTTTTATPTATTASNGSGAIANAQQAGERGNNNAQCQAPAVKVAKLARSRWSTTDRRSSAGSSGKADCPSVEDDNAAILKILE
jgi:filamentous hemagglutinin family protein